MVKLTLAFEMIIAAGAGALAIAVDERHEDAQADDGTCVRARRRQQSAIPALDFPLEQPRSRIHVAILQVAR